MRRTGSNTPRRSCKTWLLIEGRTDCGVIIRQLANFVVSTILAGSFCTERG